MMFLALWAVAVALLACWSGFIWAAHALLTALLAHAGQLGAAAGDWSLPPALTDLLPAWASEWLVGALENFTPQLQWLAVTLPGLAGWVDLLGWLVWGVGALLLLIGGVAIHVAVALVRKSKASAMTNGAGPAVS